MLLTFQDRLRLPWRGGAKQILLDAIKLSGTFFIPIFVLPFVIFISAINFYAATVMFCSCCVFIGYFYCHVQRTLTRTNFFRMWIFWSVIYMIILFEFTVPLMEILPEENFILVLLSISAIFCLWQTRKRAALNQVPQSTVAEDELPDITEATAAEEEVAQTALLMEHDLDELADMGRHQPNICANCHKYVPARTAHCIICGTCILRRDHHSFWLDCCIGQWNHSFYLSGLILAELALLLGANLTLTAVCHPFLIVRFLTIPIMLPDDCSEVFEAYNLGISFVIAFYALIMAGYIILVLLRQIYLISRGRHTGNQKTIWNNWKAFLF